MPETRIDSAVSSDLASAFTDYSVPSQSTDGATDQKETTFQTSKWNKYLGYYKAIPELRAVIDAKATWTIGKGFQADEQTTLLLDTIRGNGFDTFNSILENISRTMQINGDSFAEIIRDEEENLINLKPLSPDVIKIVVNRQGLIIRYEQTDRTKERKAVKTFKPEEIFHISRNRVADEIHGVSMIEALEENILMRNEAMDDYKTLLHRNIYPLWIYHLDTDDTAEIAKIKATGDKARGKNEAMYVPKDVVVPELVSIGNNATLNPLPWITNLTNKFYQESGVPQIVVGGGGEFTEASAKIAYLAFQQTIEEDQLFFEEQTLVQLNLVINLEFPASLENELLSDKAKDGDETIEPSETTAGEGQ